MPFGWSRKVQVTVDRQKQVDIGYAIGRLEHGDLSTIGGEDLALFFDGIALLEPRIGQAVEGNIRGKIARGLYFHVPVQNEPELELSEVDRGTLTINKGGISFAGRTRRIGIGFSAIESMSHNNNALTLVARSSHKLHFGSGAATANIKVQDREYNLRLSGMLLRLVVEACMKAALGGR